MKAPQWTSELIRYDRSRLYNPLQLYDQSFVVSQALDTLLSFALRDFVASWYSNITPSPVFANEVDRNIRTALVEIRDRVLQEDMVNVIVSRVVPIITNHLRDYDQAERAVRGRSLNRNVTESEELELAIAAKYKDGKLHAAASLAYSDAKTIQQDHLRKILVRILPDVLIPSMMGSRATLVLVKEIVSCAVLSPVMQLLADPDTWNQIIEAYGRTTLHDRQTVRRMRAALDQHTSLMNKPRAEQELPRLAADDSERAFERFVRAIRKTKNLSDARRFRSSIASQIQRESLVEGQDPTYLRRLEMAKRVLDQKITKLSRTGSTVQASVSQSDIRTSLNVKPRDWTLVEIMHTASGLSYFMEYMDRQQKMSLVQFWVVVDGLRNPLEDDFGDDTVPGAQHHWTDVDRMDIAQISETYMLKPELKIPHESKEAIKAFLVAGRKATPHHYQSARTAILSAQSAVLEELTTQHLPTFRKSDLYYKFLASSEASSMQPRRQSSDQIAVQVSPVQNTPTKLQPNAMTRANSQPPLKPKDLRRAAASSTDVRNLGSSKLFDDDLPKRSGASAPLFDDGYDTDPLAHSTNSLGHESLNGDTAAEQRQVIESMEAAMNNIMTDEPLDDGGNYDDDALFGSPTSVTKPARPLESPRDSLDIPNIDSMPVNRLKPSLATLGLVNTSSRIGVFRDNDLFPDEEKFLEDEYVDKEGKDDEIGEDEIHEAAPGDLGLAEAITGLTNDIERLTSQESVVDALTRKAELTNNVAELRILSKSKSSLQREIRRKELQRQQYIVQESDNSLYGRSNISIQSVVVGKEEDGREFALYVVEVQRQAGDQMPAAVWVVTRRYSEFHELHQHLRRRYPSTRELEFPRRRVVMKLQKQFLQNRRLGLEVYLQQLLRMPDVCRSRELRSFLSQQSIGSHDTSNATDTQDIVSRIYNSVTDGMDEFLGNISVLDQLSVAGQNLISAATSQLGMVQSDVVSVEAGPVAEAEAELAAFEDKELEPFVKPICDIFLETFELNRGNNWLRGRAVVVVLHQLLGGTIERKVRELVKGFTQEDALLKYIATIKDIMWPGGGKMRESKPRTPAEKKKSKTEAELMVKTLVPDLAASVVGRANAQAAARRISATMNNARLNQHLVFTILDEIVGVLFDPSKKTLT